jgi:two-component system response regulator LytT
MTHKILVVEDEPLVAKRVLRLTASILGSSLQHSHAVSTVAEAEMWLNQHEVDLILLDLNLAGEDGFDLLARFTAKAAHTIVISAETHRAIEAFEFGVLDFVAKPFTEGRLEKAIGRLSGSENEHLASVKHLSFETVGGHETIPLTDILYFKAADKYSEAILTTGATKFHGKSLNRLQEVLEDGFVRSHKSYLVRSAAINELKSSEGSRYEMVFTDGTRLPIGRTRVDLVRQRIDVN